MGGRATFTNTPAWRAVGLAVAMLGATIAGAGGARADVVATSPTVDAPASGAGATQATGGGALTQTVQLPVRIGIDPAAGTAEGSKLVGHLVTTDEAGEVIASSPLDFTLSQSPTTAAAGSPSGPAPEPCNPTVTPPGFRRLPQFYVTLTGNPDVYLQYGFYPFQMDGAEKIDGVDQRQFVACVTGGGSTFNGVRQSVNGAASTVEEPISRRIGEGSWGTHPDNNRVSASLDFKIAPPPPVPVSVSGSIPIQVADSYSGGSGASQYAPDLSPYQSNQVNGWWKTKDGIFENGTTEYTGNVHLGGPWEYPMTDSSAKTIRGEAYMRFTCSAGPFGLGECADPRPVGAQNSYNTVNRGNTIAVGAGHSLAVKGDETVWSWGFNRLGQLGDGTTTDRSSPVQVAGLTNVSTVAAGNFWSLALKTDGTVWAWGDDRFGWLGDGYPESSLYYRPAPAPVPGLVDVKQVSAGAFHGLALKSDGTVWQWGAEWYDEQILVHMVSGLSGVVAVSAGTFHRLALRADGSLWAWGRNDYGQLGDGTTTDRVVPVAVSGPGSYVAVSAGGVFSLGLKSDGSIWAWGSNYGGELGDGTTTDRHSPVLVSGLGGAASVEAGCAHSMARKNDGTVWTWGDNGAGELGDGTLDDRSTPVQVTGLALSPATLSLAAGECWARPHSLAVKADGTVWAWGDNRYGQLGIGLFSSVGCRCRTSATQSEMTQAHPPPG